jgi:hypothetical protein
MEGVKIMNQLEWLVFTVVLLLVGGVVFYSLIPLAFTDASLRKDIRKLRAYFLRKMRIATRYGTELGGYVHDTATSFWVAPTWMHYVTGTWADAAGAVANTIAKTCTLGDNTAVITIPCVPLQNSANSKGFYLMSVDVWFELLTAAPTALDALFYSTTLPADTAVMVVATTLPFSYDTGHDTAGERDNVDQHKMTCTLTTPIWIDNDQIVGLQITIDGATNSVVHMLGARVNGTVRL